MIHDASVFSTSEAWELTGCTDRQLQHWVVRGYLHAEPDTPGRAHRFSLGELVRACVIRRLLDGKNHTPRGLAALREIADVDLSVGDLLLVSPRVAVMSAERIADLARHECVTVLPIAAMRNRIYQRVYG